jgi:F-type H+-transporting ATPase subunit gamma
MAKGLPVIRRRLSSIKATKKVAKAMEMIATTKLKNWRNSMLEGRQYTVELFDLLQRQMKHEDFVDIPYYETPSSNAILYIVVTSNLGLCGSYNANVLSYLAKRFTPNDRLFIVGEKGLKMLKANDIEANETYVRTHVSDEDSIKLIASVIQETFIKKQFQSIQLVYTKYVNSLVNDVRQVTLLPLTVPTTTQPLKFEEQPLIEPNPKEVLMELVPFYLTNVLYGLLMDAQVAEQSSRRNAMEKASDNADELIDKLQLEFNKTRQANITQEIAEIIGGSQS